MQYSYILFDLDGTLTDPKEGITKSVQYALADQKIDVLNIDDLLCFIGPPLADSFMTNYHMDLDHTLRAITKYRERFVSIGLFENKVYDGIFNMLEKLKVYSKKLAVATSKPYIYTIQILEKFNLRYFFDVIVGSELDGTRTNKAEVIEETLRQLGVSDRKEVVMVGDRKHDIIGAKTCNIDSVGVSFGYAPEGELEACGAEKIVTTVLELTEFLCNT